MEISYSPSFLRALKSLPEGLQEEAIEKIALLANEKYHRAIKVHKLEGRLRGCYSFSVNYKVRIVFEYIGKPRRAYLLTIGDHDIYT